MKIHTSAIEQTARLRADLRLGRPVLLRDNKNFGLVFATETLKKEALLEIKKFDFNLSHLAITARRAATLNAIPYDGDVARIALENDVSYNWLLATANPALDLQHPLKGPFKTLRNGEAHMSRAAIDLCKKAHLLPSALIVNLFEKDFKNLKSAGLLSQDSQEILNKSSHSSLLHEASAAYLPLQGMAKSRIYVFRDSASFTEHYAIEVGNPKKESSLLVRIHCACFTGDVIGSLKCDCGAQLKGAMKILSKNGSGMLIYLNQEGRGIGLANKMRAYELQNQGFDTVEANHRLGFEDEERDLRIGAQIIKHLGFKKIRLLTNNPKKIASMSDMGIVVEERLNLLTKPTKENASYLSTKASKSGHII
ncbi:MAG: GTP cyclohydrolase II [Paracoccaceae bacterium]|nr:GTP cyclohydrolase II [Paracoccaceae bacterium]